MLDTDGADDAPWTTNGLREKAERAYADLHDPPAVARLLEKGV